MDKVLIVDDDKGLCNLLACAMQKYNETFETVFALNGEEAITILEQEEISLLVTDLIMPKVDGFALLSHTSEAYPAMPCIVMTSYAIPGLQKKLSQKNYNFLQKPVEPKLLAGLILKELEQSDRNGGALSGISVSGFMQIIEAEQKSCLLTIHTHAKKQGLMCFFEGKLYDAICGRLKGEDAAIKLIGLSDAHIESQQLSGKKIPRRINTSAQPLILKAMKMKDEAEGNVEQPMLHDQDDMLEDGIRLCEGLNFHGAQRVLLHLVKMAPNNVYAWVWLSRTLTSMNQILTALKKAYDLDPKRHDVKEELMKVRSAGTLSKEQVNRCPFCYAPLDLKLGQCHYCKAHLRINNAILSEIGGEADRKKLHQALVRFDRVLTEELNKKVLFYAGLACLNLNDFTGALQYHEQLQQCPGDEKDIYIPTVERIVSYVASRHTALHKEDSSLNDADVPVLTGLPRNKTVLVVEDSPTTRKVIKMSLQANGFEVIEAADGVEALSKLSDTPPHLILLDVMLPKLDGYGILSVLKQNKDLKKVPVIMLTSKDSLKDKLKGRFSRANAYLTKPFKPEMLIKQVNKYIKNK